MPRVHKTMRGSSVNMDQLRIKHEKQIAIGNMNVNAGGDEIGPGGKVVRDRNQRIREEKALHTAIPSKVKVASSKVAAEQQASDAKADVDEKELAAKILADADIPVVDASKTPKGGLAASLAETEGTKQTKEK